MLTHACTLHIFGSFHVTYSTKILLGITYLSMRQLLLQKVLGGKLKILGEKLPPRLPHWIEP